MIDKIHFSDSIYIAAADSLESDKQKADLICTGVNDQDVIQSALDSISTEKCGEIRGLRVVLLPGNYYISAFPRKNKYGSVAIILPSVTNVYDHIAVLISGSEYTESTIVHVTPECYEKVGADEVCAIFACETINANHYVFKDLYVTVPDNQKNIICYDGRLMGSMGLYRNKCICETSGHYLSVNPVLPVEGFVAFMGTSGSNNMWQEKWEFCHSIGFGQGFAVGSEHLLMHKCAALFGRYGFTFNNYPMDHGVVAHPMTLIGCIDEANANLWKFGKNKYRQSISAYNTSFEVFPTWFSLDGHYATEENPGDYYGHIDFVINQGCDTPNDPTVQFWASGSGVNFQTINNIHKKVCSSDERRSYAATPGQEVFDIDVNRKLIYTGSAWVDALGNPVD